MSSQTKQTLSSIHQELGIQQDFAEGRKLDEILKNVAAPGFSEHHTGRAIDITTQECPPLSEEFEKTQAFEWLKRNAGNFGFSLSFPRNNPQGYIYEPWHWCFNS